jgi:hypothetical protein
MAEVVLLSALAGEFGLFIMFSTGFSRILINTQSFKTLCFVW